MRIIHSVANLRTWYTWLFKRPAMASETVLCYHLLFSPFFTVTAMNEALASEQQGLQAFWLTRHTAGRWQMGPTVLRQSVRLTSPGRITWEVGSREGFLPTATSSPPCHSSATLSLDFYCSPPPFPALCLRKASSQNKLVSITHQPSGKTACI